MSLLLHVPLQSKPNAPPRLLQNFQKFTRETEPTTLSNLFSLGEGGWFGRPRSFGSASAVGRRGWRRESRRFSDCEPPNQMPKRVQDNPPESGRHGDRRIVRHPAWHVEQRCSE